MDNNYTINTNGAVQKTKIKYTEENDSLKKLNAFNAKMTKSDFNSSYTRYSIELKLVDEALSELSGSDLKDVIEQLTSRRKILLEELKRFGVSYH